MIEETKNAKNSTQPVNIISKETIKRIMKDIKDVYNDKTLGENYGIYYQHNTEQFLEGYCLIVGGRDTPYFGGYYFFKLTFPSNYPYSPPVVSYHTNSNNIRFNPNFYTNSKVCLSILNTWYGEAWSSCESIKSVLLHLSLRLCKNPLLNEPRVDEKRDINRINTYTQIIEYSNINVAVCDVILKTKQLYTYSYFDIFEKQINEHFIKNYQELLEFVATRPPIENRFIDFSSCYSNMKVNIQYPELMNKLIMCNNIVLSRIDNDDKNIDITPDTTNKNT